MCVCVCVCEYKKILHTSVINNEVVSALKELEKTIFRRENHNVKGKTNLKII